LCASKPRETLCAFALDERPQALAQDGRPIHRAGLFAGICRQFVIDVDSRSHTIAPRFSRGLQRGTLAGIDANTQNGGEVVGMTTSPNGCTLAAYETTKRHAPAKSPTFHERHAMTLFDNSSAGFTHRTCHQP